MKQIHIQFRAERALFRNMAMPGADVADTDFSERHRAIYGLLGNMLGIWRDFDDENQMEIAPSLQKWIGNHGLEIEEIRYPVAPSVRTIGQHRYKNAEGYMKAGESGPKNVTYHWNVQLDVTLKISDEGANALIEAARKPAGLPYLGQSNCLSQVFIKNVKEI